jgi:hypothetical protein
MAIWGSRIVRLAFAICLVPALFSGATTAYADNRVALVSGNGAYQNAPRLPNPRNDAEDAAAVLERSDFAMIFGSDMDKAAMDDAVIRFRQSRAHRRRCGVLLQRSRDTIYRHQLSGPG